MLLTIYNLPAQTRYVDVKSLIHSKCGFKEVILDNLTLNSNNSKKVTVGLAEEEDAAILVRKINGLFVDGQQLYVETVKKKAASTVLDLGSNQQPQPLLQQPYYQQSNYQPNYELGYTEMQQSRAQSMVPTSMAHNGMYGTAQSASANYGYPQQMQYQSAQQQMMAQPMVGYDQGSPLGFGNQGNTPSLWSAQNDWNLAGNASAGNQFSQQSRNSSSWENTGDSSRLSRHDAPARDSGRDRQSPYGQGARDSGRNAPRRDFGRDAYSRDRVRDAPRDHGRDRDQRRDRNEGRDRDHGRDRGRDVSTRDRGRVPPFRNAPPREHDRDAFYNRRPEPSRAPTKRQITSPPAIYGDHVTNSAPHSRRFPQQRDVPKPNPTWNKPKPKPKKAESNYVPPSKRPKKNGASVQKIENPQAKVPLTVDQEKKKKQRTTTWRHQIASIVAKEILKDPNHKTDVPQEQLLAELKRTIRSRLETLFGEDDEIRMPEMLKIYKEKYDGSCDTAFFNQACEEIKTNGSNLASAAGKKATPVVENSGPTTAEGKKPVVQTGVTSKKIPSYPQGAIPVVKNSAPTTAVEKKPVVQTGVTTKIPSYPQGDKKANKGLKKVNAQIFQDEEILLSKMKPAMQKALNDEIDEMCSLIASEFEGESDQQPKHLDELVKTTVVDDYKKMMKVNLAKRMLNVGPIMIRIFNVPKIISRSKLAPALAKYGVTSLRKSEKKKPPIYYGTCETYDDHDRLCAMEPIVVDGSTVTIKPFHLTGKDKNPRINRDKNRAANDMDEDPMMEELEELDDEIDEGIMESNTDYELSNTLEENDGQDENENEDTNELENEGMEMVDDEDTNGNNKLEPNEEQENFDYDDAENAQLPDPAVKSEIKSEDTKDRVSKSAEDNIGVDNTQNKADTPITTEENVKKTIDDYDFTADVCVDVNKENKDEDSFKIDGETDLEAEKELSELNNEDLEDLRGNNIDEIDMADLNDDDLEDW